jgi:transcriptional regulator with XRE-family HTH domain
MVHFAGGVVTNSELFGARLRDIRRSKGLKQVQLARALDIDPKHVSRLEHGKVNPSFDIMFHLAQYLGVSASVFLDFDSAETNSKVLRDKLLRILDKRTPRDLQQAYRILKALFDA